MKKKFISALLTMSLVTSAFSLSVQAEDFYNDDFFIEESGNAATDMQPAEDISSDFSEPAEDSSFVEIPVIIQDEITENENAEQNHFAEETELTPSLPSIQETPEDKEEDSDFYSQEEADFILADASAVIYDADQIALWANRSIQDVADKYSDAREAGSTYKFSDSSSWYSTQPSLKAPYSIGVITQDTHTAMTAATNFYRWLVGVSPLQTVSTHSDALQGQAFDRNWQFDHYIDYSSKPADMPSSIWDVGYPCTHNILSMGTSPFYSINNWMNEGYSLYSNSWDTLGHRYALIDSDVSGLQFGFSGSIAVGAITGYQNKMEAPFSAFPAPGYMPSSEISPGISAWNVEINTNIIQNPDPSNVTVTVTNLRTNNSYTCTKANGKGQFGSYYLNFAQPDDYYSTSNGSRYTDSYRVEIQGLVDVATAEPAVIRYTVKFVDITNYIRAYAEKADTGFNTITLYQTFSDLTALKKTASILPKTVYVTADNGQRVKIPAVGSWKVDTSRKCFYISADASSLPYNITDPYGLLNRVELPYEISSDYYNSYNYLHASSSSPLDGESLDFSLYRPSTWCQDSQIFKIIPNNDGSYSSFLAFDSKNLSTSARENLTHTYTKRAAMEDSGEYISIYFSCEDIESSWGSDAFVCTKPVVLNVEHNYNSGEVTKAATYTSTGIRTFTCKECGVQKTETIAKLDPLPAPVISSLTNSSSGIVIKWGAVNPATTYRILRKTDSGSWQTLKDTSSLSYTDQNVKSGTSYTYTVQCITEDSSAVISYYDTVGKTKKYIAKPALPTVSNTSTGVKVTWKKVTGAEKYRVFRKTGSGSWKKVKDTTATNIVDTTAASGKTYSYTIRCINSTGKAYTSAYNTTGKSITYLAAPTVTLKKSSSKVVLSWKKVTGATSYRIYRKVNNGSWKKLADTTKLSYDNKSVKKGNTYYYRVRAIKGTTLSSYKTNSAVKY